MSDMKPHALSLQEWEEIAAIPTVREAWGLEDGDGADFLAYQIYGAKFGFVSGSPGYVGDLFILQGDVLTGDPPIVLRRGDDGDLILS
jgi:hypothetical protein